VKAATTITAIASMAKRKTLLIVGLRQVAVNKFSVLFNNQTADAYACPWICSIYFLTKDKK
jgi:hypothetical protein